MTTTMVATEATSFDRRAARRFLLDIDGGLPTGKAFPRLVSERWAIAAPSTAADAASP